MLRNCTQAGLVALAIAGTPAAALAATIVDTGVPSNPSNSWSVFGEDIPPLFQYLAARFQVNHATALTSVEGFVGGAGGSFTISVASDTGGDAATDTPFATLYSQRAYGGYGDGGWSGARGVSWALDPGTYWVVFSVLPDRMDTLSGYMNDNAPNPASAYAYYNVPEDGWGRFDALNIGVRIGDSVPEPAAWALMIAGFGMTGAALRRRRAVAGC